MAGNWNFGMTGGKELLAQFRKIEESMQRQILVDTSRHGAQRVLTEARRRAPRDTGTLATSGQQLRVTRRKTTDAEARVTTTVAGSHAILQEFGVAPHKISFKDARGKKHSYKHPGHKAQPFMKPAYQAVVDAVQKEIADQLAAKIVAAAGGGSPAPGGSE